MHLVVTAVAVLITTAADLDPATTDELKGLAGKKAWAALLERAETTRPGNRDDAWKALVATASANVVRAMKNTKEPFEPAAKADALRGKFTFLDQQAGFLAARDEAVLAGAARCAKKKDDECWNQCSLYDSALTPGASLKLGKLLKKSGFAPHRPMTLFARAVGGPDAPACKDADVQAATLAALDTPSDSDAAAAGKKVAFEWCWSALEPKLKASMKGASKDRLANSCAAMVEKKALAEDQQAACGGAGGE